RELKQSRQTLGVQTLEEIGDRTFATLFSAFARIAAVTRPYNIVVTNVPGPQFPIYFLGARMGAVYPLVPLYRNQALGIALFSYENGLYWGFNADWDAVPDLHDVVDAVAAEFELFRGAAASGPLEIAAARQRRSSTKKPARRPRAEQRGQALQAS
ncbi:MAG TPA: WS/DGAT domain-containing protein, partial [Candidatus Kryptonia bacterium]|nr:WS/DGAT domain-containing protein [Candidatus Kryptonia bacterium]